MYLSIYIYIHIFTYPYVYVKYIKMRERENKERDFKELGQVIVEAGKSEICGVGPQSANSRKICSLSLQAACWQNSLSLGVSQSFP